MQKTTYKITLNQAEIIALKALKFLASQEKYLLSFLNSTGLSPKDLLEHASNPEILGSILEFLLQNEEKLIDFCKLEDINPSDIASLQEVLVKK